jgi:hypothetical protein
VLVSAAAYESLRFGRHCSSSFGLDIIAVVATTTSIVVIIISNSSYCSR